MMNAENFALAIEAATVVEREVGIGTLSEGLLHSAIKYYYQPDPRLHEMKVNGCVCDALAESYELGRTLIEVQTANFRYLPHKLERYFASVGDGAENAEADGATTEPDAPTAEPDGAENGEPHGGTSASETCETGGACMEKALSGIARSGKETEFPGRVTVVYPLESAKQIIRVDPRTGETKEGKWRKNLFIPAHALWELYSLRDYIGRAGFTLILLGVEIKETRERRGVKRGRERYERTARIPLALTHELVFREKSDYCALLPEGLPERFTAKEFSRLARLTDRTARYGLYFLMQIGLLGREKEGREYRYYRT